MNYKDGIYYVVHGTTEYKVAKEPPSFIRFEDSLFYEVSKNRQRMLFHKGCQMPGDTLGQIAEINGNIAYIVNENDDFVIKIYSISDK